MVLCTCCTCWLLALLSVATLLCRTSEEHHVYTTAKHPRRTRADERVSSLIQNYETHYAPHSPQPTPPNTKPKAKPPGQMWRMLAKAREHVPRTCLCCRQVVLTLSWTPKVCNIMVFWICLEVLGLSVAPFRDECRHGDCPYVASVRVSMSWFRS